MRRNRTNKAEEKELQLPETEVIESELNRIKGRKRYFSVLRSTVFSLLSVAAVTVLICVFLMPVLRIYGTSMEPTLHDGNIVAALKGSKFETGDLIAFYCNNKILVKRVIANSGQWVHIDNMGNVSVDDEKLDEPYVYERARGDCTIDFPYQVPEGRIFVLGDHRRTSVDSRNSAVGCIAEEQIVGRISFRVWPLSEIGFFRTGE